MLLGVLVLSLQLAAPARPPEITDIVREYIAAVQSASQNPQNVAYQLAAARLGFATLQLAEPWRKEAIARSIARFARNAVRLEEANPEANLWMAIGIGEVALAYNAAELPTVAEKYGFYMQRCLALAPGSLGALGLAHWSWMHTVAPQNGSWSRARAAQLLQEALQHGQVHSLTWHAAAQLALIQGEPARAQRMREQMRLHAGAEPYARTLANVFTLVTEGARNIQAE